MRYGNLKSEVDNSQVLSMNKAIVNNISTPSDPIGDGLRADAIAYWKMDEASGTRADSTGHGYNLSQVNSVGSTTGKINNAIICDNNLDYIRYTGSGLSLGNTNYAFSFWTKFSVLPELLTWTIISKGESNGNGEYYIEIEDEGDYMRFSFNGDSGFSVSTSPSLTISLDTWYFVVCEHDFTNSKSRIYVNNQLEGENDTAFPTNVQGNIFSIGFDITGIFDGFIGIVDETLVLGRLSTSDERDYLYNLGDGRTLYP